MREKYKGNARDAHLHMQYMFVALDTSHAERSSLKSLQPSNAFAKLVTLDTSLSKNNGAEIVRRIRMS